jgi:hypothetical protein
VLLDGATVFWRPRSRQGKTNFLESFFYLFQLNIIVKPKTRGRFLTEKLPLISSALAPDKFFTRT